MLGCNLTLDVDLGEFDFLLFIEFEFEFFVLLPSFFKELHGGGFQLDRFSICHSLGLEDLGFAQSSGGGFFGNSFGEHLLGERLFLGGGLLGFGSDDALFGIHLSGLTASLCFLDYFVSMLVGSQLSGFLLSFRFFDATNELFLGLGLRDGDCDLFLTVRSSELFSILDALLLFDHAFFDGDPLANHLLNFLLLNLDCLLGFDGLELGNALAFDLL